MRPSDETPGSAAEVLAAFAKLGVTCFGGPITHIGYFRDEFVVRRRWLDEAAYADLVALCQFLPGPASSQVGLSLGLLRAGPLGALAAWTAFTIPSALLMVAFAYGASAFTGAVGEVVLHGLKLVAVAIVAQAVFGMTLSLAPGRARGAIAVGAVALVTLLSGAPGQIGAIAAGAAAGLVFCRDATIAPPGRLTLAVSQRTALACGVAFVALLFGLPLARAATQAQSLALFDAFYRSGALVFGGGHVVLPLLRAAVVPQSWIDDGGFLAGYGAAQAMPGPLFTFAAYLGAAMRPQPHGIVGAAIALAGIFLPGFLILLAALPFWNALRATPLAQAALRGTNASVVGILAAALYNPVWTSAVQAPRDFLVALAGFVALVAWKSPPSLVVIGIVALTAAI